MALMSRGVTNETSKYLRVVPGKIARPIGVSNICCPICRELSRMPCDPHVNILVVLLEIHWRLLAPPWSLDSVSYSMEATLLRRLKETVRVRMALSHNQDNVNDSGEIDWARRAID